MRRMGKPEELTVRVRGPSDECVFHLTSSPHAMQGSIVYLASDASKFMTGAELRVDGVSNILRLLLKMDADGLTHLSD